MDKIKTEISMIKAKVSEDVEGIDEVMMLLEYIEVIKRPESKIDELS